jgi:hypothetical protein
MKVSEGTPFEAWWIRIQVSVVLVSAEVEKRQRPALASYYTVDRFCTPLSTLARNTTCLATSRPPLASASRKTTITAVFWFFALDLCGVISPSILASPPSLGTHSHFVVVNCKELHGGLVIIHGSKS